MSNNCPVCRKEYKTILHNLNTAVKVIKFSDDQAIRQVEPEESSLEEEMHLPTTANAESNQKKNDSFYIFEAGEQQMVGVPITNDKHMTNNIVQLNTNRKTNIPEIDVVNMTRNENGGRIITRHNYQLTSAEQQELLNELINSAINRSIEEHNETISQINANNANPTTEHPQQSNLTLNHMSDLTRIIDIYTFDRTRPMYRRRNRNINVIRSNASGYNLRPIVGSRANPHVNRTRLFEWNL